MAQLPKPTVITGVGTSSTDLSAGATRVASPCVDNLEVRRGGDARHVASQ
jgi:hypothetical protein